MNYAYDLISGLVPVVGQYWGYILLALFIGQIVLVWKMLVKDELATHRGFRVVFLIVSFLIAALVAGVGFALLFSLALMFYPPSY